MKDKIMLRIDPNSITLVTEMDGREQITMGRKLTNGYIQVSEDAINQDKALAFWINLALEFNPLAKASKKTKVKL